MNRSIRLVSVAAALVLGSGSIVLAQGGSNSGASGVVNPNCIDQPGTTGTLSGGTSASGMTGGSAAVGSGSSATVGGTMSSGSAGQTGGSGMAVASGPSGMTQGPGVSGNSARSTGGC